MKKDAYYFPHDSNAKDDPKCVLLIEQLGLEGYGAFWILIETLREQPNYKYPLALLPAIARRYNTTFEKMKTVVFNYGLFQVSNDEFFFSESLNSRMKAADYNRISGIKGALKKHGYLNDAQIKAMTDKEIIDYQELVKNKEVSPLHSPLPAPPNSPPLALERKGEERKGKEKKEKEKSVIFSDEIKNFTASLSNYFNKDLIARYTDAEKWGMVDTIDKLIRLDNFKKEDIEKAVKLATGDNFWKKQFLSLSKLRKRNDDGVKYIDVFLALDDSTNNENQKNQIYAEALKEFEKLNKSIDNDIKKGF